MNSDFQIKTDVSGHVDTQYYMDQARQLRADYHAELIANLVKKVKVLFHIKTPNITLRHTAHH